MTMLCNCDAVGLQTYSIECAGVCELCLLLRVWPCIIVASYQVLIAGDARGTQALVV
jgi:hypothetical protein